MARMKVHNYRNAPEETRAFLKILKENKGGIPDLAGVAAASPALFQAMGDLFGRFQRTSLEPEEKELVVLAACKEYGNEYALELQSYTAREAGLPDHVIEALREQRPEDRPWQDERYNALWTFVAAVIDAGGRVGDGEMKAFRKAGFAEAQMLDVLLGISVAGLLTNVAGLAALTPDRKFRWSRGGLLSWR